MEENELLSQIRRIDHLGIVSGVARKIRLVEIVDEMIPPAPQRRVTVEEAVLSLVLNGLGFVSRPLYLTPAYFETKPVGTLIRPGLTEEDLNEFTQGRALDDLHEAGLSSLFLHVASSAVKFSERGTTFFHLDSTSFTLSGRCPASEAREENDEDDGEPEVIRITHGYSKDHRPDLKQFVLNMITLHKSRIPIWVEALDGNTVDKTSFARTIQSFLPQVKGTTSPMLFVADSALTPGRRSGSCRARSSGSRGFPRPSGSCVTCCRRSRLGSFVREERSFRGFGSARWAPPSAASPSDGSWSFPSPPGNGRRRRWPGPVAREKKALESSLRALFSTVFSCEEDARAAWDETFGKVRYHRASECLVSEETGHARSGRPRKDAKPEVQGYRLSGSFEPDPGAINQEHQRKGFFVVASNHLDDEALSAPEMIALYKSQGTSIESGFRFYKDPLFFADAFFLKSETRIMALTMVMGIALLIYALAEEELRRTLARLKASVPDQKEKPTSRPTMRWIFQLTDGINWMPSRGDPSGAIWMKEVQKKIISFFSPEVKAIYGVP